MNKLPQMDFPLDTIKLNLLYEEHGSRATIGQDTVDAAETTDTPNASTDGQGDTRPAALPKITAAFTEFSFPPAPAERPYLISSVVLSADGKMAFEDISDGPAIAKQNRIDPNGALSDFWVLNALRASSDAVIIGAGTLNSEANTSGHIFDPELIEQRLASRRTAGKQGPSGEVSSAGEEKPAGKKLEALNRRHPINIIVSFDGRDIPLDHFLFNIDPAEQLPTAVMTSPAGGEYLLANFSRTVRVYHSTTSPYTDRSNSGLTPETQAAILRDLDPHSGVLPVITTGAENRPDTIDFLALLHHLGLQLVLVESPSYTSHLMHLGCMDEAFVNYSMIYAGGTRSPGSGLPFTHNSHPHVKLQALALHSASFIYTRQRLYYGIGEE